MLLITREECFFPFPNKGETLNKRIKTALRRAQNRELQAALLKCQERWGILTLSTGHLRFIEAEALYGDRLDVMHIHDRFGVCDMKTDALFLVCHADEDNMEDYLGPYEQAGFSKGFLTILAAASLAKISHIRWSGDGDIIEGLKTYEW